MFFVLAYFHSIGIKITKMKVYLFKEKMENFFRIFFHYFYFIYYLTLLAKDHRITEC